MQILDNYSLYILFTIFCLSFKYILKKAWFIELNYFEFIFNGLGRVCLGENKVGCT